MYIFIQNRYKYLVKIMHDKPRITRTFVQNGFIANKITKVLLPARLYYPIFLPVFKNTHKYAYIFFVLA